MAKPIAQLEPRPVIKYGVAVLAVAASVIGSLLLQASLDITPVVSLMLCGVMFAAWFGGLGPGLLAVALSLLAFDYFFVPPLYSFGLRYNDALRVGLFALAALFIVALSTKQRSAAQSLRRMHDDLQTALSELERVNASLQTENADRRRAEAELRRSERALQTIIDTIPAYVARFRPDGVPDFMNQTLHNFFGASVRLEEMRRTMHPDDLPQNLREWNAHIASGEPYENECGYGEPMVCIAGIASDE